MTQKFAPTINFIGKCSDEGRYDRACTAGLATPEVWHGHYSTWGHINGSLANKIQAFIEGTTAFFEPLNIPPELAAALIAMVVVSFALTTLDSATRLLRFRASGVAKWLSRERSPTSNNIHAASPGSISRGGLPSTFRPNAASRARKS